MWNECGYMSSVKYRNFVSSDVFDDHLVARMRIVVEMYRRFGDKFTPPPYSVIKVLEGIIKYEFVLILFVSCECASLL
jgi:hypothetical protein